MFDPGRILEVFARREADCLLIGGMNFYFRHRPVSTFDVDLWIADDESNRERVVAALAEIQAQWGETEESWAPIPRDTNWLTRHGVYCLTSSWGAIDLFRFVRGLDDYETCKARSTVHQAPGGLNFRCLSDADMLACQLALPEGTRRLDRVAYLQNLLKP